MDSYFSYDLSNYNNHYSHNRKFQIVSPTLNCYKVDLAWYQGGSTN